MLANIDKTEVLENKSAALADQAKTCGTPTAAPRPPCAASFVQLPHSLQPPVVPRLSSFHKSAKDTRRQMCKQNAKMNLIIAGGYTATHLPLAECRSGSCNLTPRLPSPLLRRVRRPVAHHHHPDYLCDGRRQWRWRRR